MTPALVLCAHRRVHIECFRLLPAQPRACRALRPRWKLVRVVWPLKTSHEITQERPEVLPVMAVQGQR